MPRGKLMAEVLMLALATTEFETFRTLVVTIFAVSTRLLAYRLHEAFVFILTVTRFLPPGLRILFN